MLRKRIDKDALFVIIIGLMMTAAVFVPVMNIYNGADNNNDLTLSDISDVYMEILEDNSVDIDLNEYFLEGWDITNVELGGNLSHSLDGTILTVTPEENWNGQESVQVQVGYNDMEFKGNEVRVNNRQISNPAVGDGTEFGPFFLGYGNIINATVWIDSPQIGVYEIQENDDYIMDYSTGEIYLTSWGPLNPGEYIMADFYFSLIDITESGFVKNEILSGSAVGNGYETEFELKHDYVTGLSMYSYHEDKSWYKLVQDEDFVFDAFSGEIILTGWGALIPHESLITSYNFSLSNPTPGRIFGDIVAGPATGNGFEYGPYSLNEDNILDIKIYSMDGDGWEFIPNNGYVVDYPSGTIYLTDSGPLNGGEILAANYNYSTQISGFVSNEIVYGPAVGSGYELGPFYLNNENIVYFVLYSVSWKTQYNFEYIDPNDYTIDLKTGEINLVNQRVLIPGEFLMASYYYTGILSPPPSESIQSSDGFIIPPVPQISWAWQNFTLNVLPVNDPPTSLRNPPMFYMVKDGSLNNVLDLDDLFVDIDSSLEFSWTSMNGHTTALINTDNEISLTAGPSAGLADKVQVLAWDGEEAVTSDIYVNTLDTNPVVFDEDSTGMIQPGELILSKWSYIDISDPVFVNYTLVKDRIKLTPDENWFGNANMQITAGVIFNPIDPGPIPGPEPIPINLTTGNEIYSVIYQLAYDLDVLPVNDEPTSMIIPDKVLDEDSTMVNALDLNDYFNDIDSDLVFDFTIDNNNLDVVLDQNGMIDISSQNNWFGTGEVTFTASDGQYVENQVIDVLVNPINDPPSALGMINETTILEDGQFSLDLSDYFADVDNTVIYSFISDKNFSVELNTTTGVTSIQPDEDWNGEGLVTFYAMDAVSEASQIVSVVVEPVNDMPVVIPTVASVNFVEDGASTLDLSSMFSDTDSSLTFSVSSGIQNVFVDITPETGLIALSSSQDWSGSGSMEVFASDGEFTVSQEISVEVTAVNDPPVVLSVESTRIYLEDSTNEIPLSHLFTDIDSDLTYTTMSSSQLDVGLDLTEEQVTISPASNWYGTSDVTIRATDGEYEVEQLITFQITAQNDAPFLKETLPQIVIDSEGETIIDLSSYYIDIDGDSLTFEISTSENLIIEGTGTVGVFKITSFGGWTGAETLSITVSDGTESYEMPISIASMPASETSISGTAGGSQGLIILVLAVFAIGMIAVTYTARTRIRKYRTTNTEGA